jgi:CRP-like cAMP-binding protein
LGLAEEKPGIWRHIAQLASMNMLLAIDVIDALRREDPVQRVAATLLNLTVHSPPGLIAISVTQSDLGAIARLSRSTVNRALTELARKGWLRLTYATVEVIDRGSLLQFVRGK